MEQELLSKLNETFVVVEIETEEGKALFLFCKN